MIGVWLGRTVGHWLGHTEAQVPASAEQPSGGWLVNAWYMGRKPVPVRRKVRRRPRRKIAAQIARLEAHLAQELKVSRGTIRLATEARRDVPPDVLGPVQRALTEQTQASIRAARIALQRYERDEEEEFAVLWALLH